MRKHLHLNQLAVLALCALTSLFFVGCDWGDSSGGGSGDNTGGGGTNGTLAVTSVALGTNFCASVGDNLGSSRTFPSNEGLRDYYAVCSSNFITLKVNVTGSTISQYQWIITPQSNALAAFVANEATRFTNTVNTATVRYTFPTGLAQTTPCFVQVNAVDTNNLSVSAFFQLNFMGTLSSNNTTSSQLLIADGFRPHLSPDATRVVFNRLSDFTGSARSQVWIVNVDGTGLTRLTNPSSSSDYWPQWSPDGQFIVFLRKDGSYDTNALGSLFQMNPDGSGLTNYASYFNIRDFCFYVGSTTATNIIADFNNNGLFASQNPWPNTPNFQQFRNSGTEMRGQSEIAGFTPNIVFFDPAATSISQATVILNPVGNTSQFVNNGGLWPWPCLSPTGQKVIAGANGGTFAKGIYKMAVTGDNPVALVTGNTGFSSTTSFQQPTWSKTTILYVSFLSGSPIEHGDIYLLNGVDEL